MAIITQIRNRVKLLVIVISLAILSFLLMDVFSNNGLFGNSGPDPLGVIDGEDIMFQSFDRRLQENVENYKINQNQNSIDEQTYNMLRDQVWSELVKSTINQKEFRKIGIGVSDAEMVDMVQGNNIHPSIEQAFRNPENGEFDRNQVINFIKNLDQVDISVKDRWVKFEQYMRDDRLNTKYNNLIQKAIYFPNVLAKMEYANKEDKASGRYIVLDYSSIQDTAVNLTDADIKSYFNQNKAQFKQKDALRKISYVLFEVKPSVDDSAKSFNQIKDLIVDFTNTTNDSLFVTLNSDQPFNDTYLGRDQLNFMVGDTFFDSEINTISAPYIDGNSYKITKLIERTLRADSVKARHILIKPEAIGIEAAKAKADSLKSLLIGGASFATLAEQNSEDPGSAANGGDLGTFAEGAMVKPFNDACFNGNKGDLVIVESQFGVHLIEILENQKTKPVIKVATISNSIEASTQTYRDVFAIANKFQGENRNLTAFENAVNEQGLSMRAADRVLVSDRSIAGIPNSREIVRWAYKAKVGEVSSVMEADPGYVVVVLKEAREKGDPSFEMVISEVEPKALKAKKASMLSNKLKEAMAKTKNLDEIATEVNGMVQNYSDVSFAASFIPSLGRETKLTGAIFRTKINEIGGPIDGERGVFVFEVTTISKAEEPTNMDDIRKTAQSQIVGRSLTDVQNAMKTKRNVIDNRHLYY